MSLPKMQRNCLKFRIIYTTTITGVLNASNMDRATRETRETAKQELKYESFEIYTEITICIAFVKTK